MFEPGLGDRQFFAETDWFVGERGIRFVYRHELGNGLAQLLRLLQLDELAFGRLRGVEVGHLAVHDAGQEGGEDAGHEGQSQQQLVA